MNIERFKWPVIVAAGLHGALLLSFPPEPRVTRTPPPHRPDRGPETPVIEPIALPPDEPASGGDGGPVSPLPSIPDVAALEVPADAITMPPVDRAMPEKPVTTLTIPPGVGGPVGEGPLNIGAPRMPGVDALDRVPRVMTQNAPRYPHELRRTSISGSAIVEFVVGTDGHVISAEAVRWTHREFAGAAVEAVLRWKFEPGTIQGRKVRFRMAIPIEFNATEG
jgi:TonB family protein